MIKPPAAAVDIERPIGFYIVSGVATVAGDDEQPAYWDGMSWWLIGWGARVSGEQLHIIRRLKTTP